MSGPLTILHLTHDGRGSGSSISIALLAAAQRDAGHRVVVGCPPGYLAERLRDAGVEWRPLERRGVGQAARTTARLCAELEPDVVNSHSSRDRAACRRLRYRGRLPAALVMTRRAMPRSTPLSAIASGLAADRIIAVSGAVARALIRRGTPRSRVRVVHNAVDLARLDRPPAAGEIERARELVAGAGHGLAADIAVIGVVSRRKDHETLLRAMALMRRPARLVSIGFEPDERLRSLALGHHPSAGVVWLPFQDPLPFYGLFDVVALPTRHEGLSQGIMEAMAFGMPIVTTRVDGNAELITEGVHGLLVAPGDAGAFAAALDRVLGDGALAARLGAAARERSRTEFTIERTLAATGDVYREAIARRLGR